MLRGIRADEIISDGWTSLCCFVNNKNNLKRRGGGLRKMSRKPPVYADPTWSHHQLTQELQGQSITLLLPPSLGLIKTPAAVWERRLRLRHFKNNATKRVIPARNH